MVFKGYCPVLKRDNQISVGYVCSGALEDGVRLFSKNKCECDYVSDGGDCTVSICPILEQAPSQLQKS